MQRIPIVFVHNTMPSGGGGERVLYDLIHGLDKARFEPVLCCLYDLGDLGEQLKSEGICAYSNLVRAKYDPRNAFRIASILARKRAKILYVTDGFHNMILGRIAAMIARTPVSVLIFHSYDTVLRRSVGPLRRMVLELGDKLLHRHFHRVIALAETHKKYLVSTKSISAERIAVIYNGIDLAPFQREADRHQLRRELQIPESSGVVGIVAGLKPWKTHSMFLSAAARVLQEAPDTYFVIAGDGPERSNLERLARELAIDDHVRFLGNVRDVPRLLWAFDLSALSSVHEAFPLCLLEAMAAARPVVATDVGSVSEIVEDGVNGYLIRAGDGEGFARAILRLLRNPHESRRMGRAGRSKVERLFTVDRMVRQSESFFEACAGPAIRAPSTAAREQELCGTRS